MSITKHNIHKHEFIGLEAKIIASKDRGSIGISGMIVDETKNTITLKTPGSEKTYQKQGTVLSVDIGRERIEIDTSNLRFRPEDRIKKAKSGQKKRAVAR